MTHAYVCMFVCMDECAIGKKAEKDVCMPCVCAHARSEAREKMLMLMIRA